MIHWSNCLMFSIEFSHENGWGEEGACVGFGLHVQSRRKNGLFGRGGWSRRSKSGRQSWTRHSRHERQGDGSVARRPARSEENVHRSQHCTNSSPFLLLFYHCHYCDIIFYYSFSLLNEKKKSLKFINNPIQQWAIELLTELVWFLLFIFYSRSLNGR